MKNSFLFLLGFSASFPHFRLMDHGGLGVGGAGMFRLARGTDHFASQTKLSELSMLICLGLLNSKEKEPSI